MLDMHYEGIWQTFVAELHIRPKQVVQRHHVFQHLKQWFSSDDKEGCAHRSDCFRSSSVQSSIVN